VRALILGLIVSAVALVALGGLARYRSARLDRRAVELGERSRAAGTAFAASFQRAQDDTEMRLMAERRETSRHAGFWGHVGLYLFGLAVVALLAAWVVRELRSFSEVAAQVPDPRKGEGKQTRPRPG
jgi:hypothetical protein